MSHSSAFLLGIGLRTPGTVAGDAELSVITIDGDDDVDGIGEFDIGTKLASSAIAAKGLLCSYGFPPRIMRSLSGDTCPLPGDMSTSHRLALVAFLDHPSPHNISHFIVDVLLVL